MGWRPCIWGTGQCARQKEERRQREEDRTAGESVRLQNQQASEDPQLLENVRKHCEKYTDCIENSSMPACKFVDGFSDTFLAVHGEKSDATKNMLIQECNFDPPLHAANMAQIEDDLEEKFGKTTGTIVANNQKNTEKAPSEQAPSEQAPVYLCNIL
tara:strand:- start:3287 stop:3757 length:471 start_codon:yes stop_codon:yes gene_type:complete